MAHAIVVIGDIILFYFFLLMIGYTVLLLASLSQVINQFKEAETGLTSEITQLVANTPILTVIIPCFNEKRRVLETVYSIMNNNFKNVQVIIVDDDSTDETMEILQQELRLKEVPSIVKQTIPTQQIKHTYISELFENLSVIHKEHGFGNGADSVNVGINAATTPLFMTLDADTVVEPDAISRLLFAFFSKGHCITVGGAVFVLNEIKVHQGIISKAALPSRLIPAFQAIEYVRSFIFGRSGFNIFGGALCYAGAFTLFEKQAVIEVGGYDKLNFSYDAEIVVKLHDYMRTRKLPYTAYFSSTAFSWTVVPSTLKSYWRQRNFWQRGLLKTFMLHKHMLFNPRYGVVGLFNVPFNLFFEILGPVIEFISYLLLILAIIFNLLAVEPVLWALILAWGYAAFLNIINFYLNIITFNKFGQAREIIKVCVLGLVEMLGFRQFRATCCAVATVEFVWNRLKGKYL